MFIDIIEGKYSFNLQREFFDIINMIFHCSPLGHSQIIFLISRFFSAVVLLIAVGLFSSLLCAMFSPC